MTFTLGRAYTLAVRDDDVEQSLDVYVAALRRGAGEGVAEAEQLEWLVARALPGADERLREAAVLALRLAVGDRPCG